LMARDFISRLLSCVWVFGRKIECFRDPAGGFGMRLGELQSREW
jgi:hypothetical protein